MKNASTRILRVQVNVDYGWQWAVGKYNNSMNTTKSKLATLPESSGKKVYKMCNELMLSLSLDQKSVYKDRDEQNIETG